MRPHKLIMKAFGPFAKETIVDFDAMGNSIYLICGNTGSGKTTIFDGIIYALYGTASGGARSGLGTEAFHSDYAKDGSHREEMRVEFSFSNAGREFTVTRTMKWGKKGESRLATKESSISENGTVIENGKGREDKDDVTAKVIEILGLDADQFRRIIMLAQGEFQKFLTAKSDERGVILGKLYDNRQHQDFQLRLKAADILLKEKGNAAVEEVKAQLKTFAFPENTSEEEYAALSVDHPELLPTIQQILKRLDAEIAALSETIQKEEEKKKGLEETETKGKTYNGWFDDLDRCNKELANLDAQKEQIEFLRKNIKRAEAAEKVLPFENELSKTNTEWNSILTKIKSLEEWKKKLEEQAVSLKEEAERIKKEKTPQIEEQKEQASSIQNILHYYENLSKSVEAYSSKEQAFEEAKESAQKAKNTLEQRQKQQKELAEELKRLESAGEMAVSNATNKKNELIKRKGALKEIQSAIYRVETLQKDEASTAQELLDARNAEVEAEKEHLRLNEAFFQGQAGALAQDMRNKLQSEAEVKCPVCGAVHTKADISLFAEWHDSIPTKEMVDQAYTSWEDARKATHAAEEKHSSKVSDLSGERNALLTKSMEWISISQWEALVDGTIIINELAGCENRIAEAEAEVSQAITDQNAKKEALKEKTTVDEAVDTAEKELLEAVDTQNNASRELATAETGVIHWRQLLQGYPENKQKAQNTIASLNEQAKAIQKQVDDAREAYSKCLQEKMENSGALSEAYSEKDSRAKAKKQAVESFAAQLEKWSFADEDDYHAALSPGGVLLEQEGLTKWISAKNKEIKGYEQSRIGLEGEIKRLAESTKGMERVNLEELREKIDQVKGVLREKREQEKKLSATAQVDHAVYNELQSIQDQRSKYQKLSAKLRPLVETADGKYAFSRYVLTGFFHRIVEQANVHLETMTDGEYCLVPKETGDGRSNIGLELKVLNTITNIERDTATLSGGQLFEASLSLALGLSDIVQMESTSSIQIDSMFIDEGFGSLDGGRLDKSLEVLQHLSAGKRQIGIISHVARLDECLPRKIHVIASDRGSTVKIETDT